MTKRFRVGEMWIDPQLGKIVRDGSEIRVRPKVIDLLQYLAQRPGEVVSKDELLDKVWHTDAISESALTRTVAELRQALGDVADQPTVLETIPKRGYRLIAPCSTDGVVAPISVPAAAPPRWWRPILAMVVLIAAGGMIGVWQYARVGGLHPVAARDWLLITTLENHTGDARLDGVIENWLAHDFSDSTRVVVVSDARIQDTLGLMGRATNTPIDASIGREVALRDGGIRLLLVGRVDRLGNSITIQLRVVDAVRDEILATVREAVGPGQPLDAAVREVSARLRARIGDLPPQPPAESDAISKVRTPSLAAARLYSNALQFAHKSQWAPAEALFAAAIAEDDQFASAHIWRAWMLYLLARWGDGDEALAVADKALALIQNATERERYFILGLHGVLTHDIEAARGNLEALTARYPDDTWGLWLLAECYEKESRRDKALALLQRWAATRPNDFYTTAYAAQMTLALEGLRRAQPMMAQASRLLRAQSEPVPVALRTYVRLFAAHELWLQRRIREASAVVDTVEAGLVAEADGMHARWLVGSFRLSLGQLTRAEAVWTLVDDPEWRRVLLGYVALARADRAGVATLLNGYRGTDLSAVSTLVRAGHLRQAQHVLSRAAPFYRTPLQRAHVQWAVSEIDRARAPTRGDRSFLDLPWLLVMEGVRSFMYSETLARSLLAKGDLPAAIAVLEATGALQERMYTRSTHNGYFWIRIQSLLAEAYRRAGRHHDADRIIRSLTDLVAMADADHDIAIQLRRSANEPASWSPVSSR